MTTDIAAAAPLRVGVIGAGFFGRLHAQKFKGLPGVVLAGIADMSVEAAREAAQKFDTKAVSSWRALLGEVDAVSIATPAESHGPIAIECLNAGLHVLVEKPIAATLADADAMIALAAAKNLVLQAGHQERFVFAASGLLERDKRPVRIECHRAGVFSPRGTDVSVALDLMTHDIDLVHTLDPAPVARVAATAKSRAGSFSDEVQAILTLEDGCRVSLFASRMGEARKRFMRVLYDDGEIEIDFLSRTLRNTTPHEISPAFFPSSDGKPGVADDPLGVAIASFADCVRAKRQPLVSGAPARRALETALMILKSAGSRPLRAEAAVA